MPSTVEACRRFRYHPSLSLRQVSSTSHLSEGGTYRGRICLIQMNSSDHHHYYEPNNPRFIGVLCILLAIFATTAFAMLILSH